VSLYRWDLKPTKEAQVPCTREVTLTVHLSGARRVHIFTERGLSRRFSRPGDITLIPRGQSIRYLVNGAADFATVHLPAAAAALFEDRAAADLLNLSECLFAFRDDYALASVRALMQTGEVSDLATGRYSAQVLDSLALHLSRILARGDAERVRLAQIPIELPSFDRSIDFEAVAAEIDARIGEQISLKDLAEIAGAGRSSFCEQFKLHFGFAPHRYILDRRIRRAKQLLSDGTRNLTYIAYELGFSSAAHFSTAFKTATGMSPRFYARRREIGS
jgi:AraC family transcriptional regulator